MELQFRLSSCKHLPDKTKKPKNICEKISLAS